MEMSLCGIGVLLGQTEMINQFNCLVQFHKVCESQRDFVLPDKLTGIL